MTLLIDLLPVLLFFVAYKVAGLMPATAVLIVVTLALAAVNWLRTRSVNRLQLVTAAAVLVFGGITLALDNELFIKWKPSVVYWLFAAVFAGSHFIGREPVVKRLLGGAVELPAAVWTRLSLSWVAFFVAVGALNLWVAYRYDTDTWVNFKLFAALGLPLLFVLAVGFYVSRHAQERP